MKVWHSVVLCACIGFVCTTGIALGLKWTLFPDMYAPALVASNAFGWGMYTMGGISVLWSDRHEEHAAYHSLTDISEIDVN